MLLIQLIVLLILAPIGIGMFIIARKNWTNWLGKTILGLFAVGILGIFAIFILHWLTSKIELDRSDIYGEYIIDRTKFSGDQSD